MTDQEIIRAVAEKVMGWEEHHLLPYSWVKDGNPVIDKEQFDPLTNPDHWMLVVERMRKLGWECQIWSFKTDYRVVFYHGFREWRELKERHYTKRESIGHAVCEAALKAVEAT